MSIEIGEFGVIEVIRKSFAPLVPAGVEGIGDDCAVIPTSEGMAMVVTSDMLAEGVHFLREADAYWLGVRCVQVNISDVAAMGATPKYLLLSISLPTWVSSEWMERFMSGIRSCNIALIGGDTTRSVSGLTISITAIGEARIENIKRRSGATVGDVILVSGELGESGYSGYTSEVRAEVEEGVWLGGREEVSSMMDISDGVAGDIKHIMEESDVGAVIELDNIPLFKGASIKHGISGGEDFKLLLTANAQSVEKLQRDFMDKFSKRLYIVGEICEGKELMFVRRGEVVNLDADGFKHF